MESALDMGVGQQRHRGQEAVGREGARGGTVGLAMLTATSGQKAGGGGGCFV